MDIFSEDRFTNEDAARAYLEGSLWPEGPVCPHCGSLKAPYANAAKRGVYRCSEKECRKDFTVTTGTVMERSHIALHKWVQGEAGARPPGARVAGKASWDVFFP